MKIMWPRHSHDVRVCLYNKMCFTMNQKYSIFVKISLVKIRVRVAWFSSKHVSLRFQPRGFSLIYSMSLTYHVDCLKGIETQFQQNIGVFTKFWHQWQTMVQKIPIITCYPNTVMQRTIGDIVTVVAMLDFVPADDDHYNHLWLFIIIYYNHLL